MIRHRSGWSLVNDGPDTVETWEYDPPRQCNSPRNRLTSEYDRNMAIPMPRVNFTRHETGFVSKMRLVQLIDMAIQRQRAVIEQINAESGAALDLREGTLSSGATAPAATSIRRERSVRMVRWMNSRTWQYDATGKVTREATRRQYPGTGRNLEISDQMLQ